MSPVGLRALEDLHSLLGKAMSCNAGWWYRLGEWEKTFLLNAINMPSEWASFTWDEFSEVHQIEILRARDACARISAAYQLNPFEVS